jgi:hypothetical protein
MRFTLVFTAIIFLFGCAASTTSSEKITDWKPELNFQQQQRWQFMVGKWYGSQSTKDGGIRKEITEKSAQGQYKTTFRLCDSIGKCEDSIEVGEWGMSGPVYFTIFKGWIHGKQFSPADPTDSYNYDTYKIHELNDAQFVYESFVSGNHYTLKKVPDEFVFPEE